MKKLLLVALCLAVFALPFALGAKEKEDRFLDIQEVTTAGGLTIWLVEDHTLPIIALNLYFDGAGSILDPGDKQGLAQLVSNTLDEGAGDLDSQAFQKTLSDNSISLSFGSGRDGFSGSLTTLTRRKDLAFNLLHLALTNPRFDKDAVERMREANKARIRSSLSDPSWQAARLLNDIAFEGHPYAKNSGGTLTSLDNITADDLRGFTRDYLTKDRLLIAAAGDITPEELSELVDKTLGDLPESGPHYDITTTTVQNGGTTTLYQRDIPQTVIEIAQPGIGRDHPDYFAYQVMNFILGGGGFSSRLTEEVREKRGLTYGIYSSPYLGDYVKMLNISTSTENSNTPEVLALITDELAKMRDGEVTGKELADAKSYLVGSMPLNISSTNSIASMVMALRSEDLPITYYDTYADNINQVTAEDIHRVAQEVLAPDNLTTILVGNPPGVTPTRTVTELPNVE